MKTTHYLSRWPLLAAFTSLLVSCANYQVHELPLEGLTSTAAPTGVLEYSLVLSDTDEGQWSDLIMTDTQISSIVVDKAAFVRFRVKTAQAGYKAQIHIYTRTRPIASV